MLHPMDSDGGKATSRLAPVVDLADYRERRQMGNTKTTATNLTVTDLRLAAKGLREQPGSPYQRLADKIQAVVDAADAAKEAA